MLGHLGYMTVLFEYSYRSEFFLIVLFTVTKMKMDSLLSLLAVEVSFSCHFRGFFLATIMAYSG